jgi:hypothetical protein
MSNNEAKQMQIIEYYEGMQIQPPMLVLNMPSDIYHAWPDSISKSGLDLIARSPAHYAYKEPAEQTRHKEIGTAIHTALLEPERFKADYVMLRDVTDRRASAYKEATKVHPASNVLTGSEADYVSGMQEAVYAHPQARRALTQEGCTESSLFVNDPVTGVLVRVRYDLLTESGEAYDLKKSQDARADAFARSIYNYGYHIQAALYQDAYEWATGKTLACFKIIAVEDRLPHAVMVYRIDDTAIAEGRRAYREALDTYAQCAASGQWPAYECAEDELIGLPEWVIRKMEYEMEVVL